MTAQQAADHLGISRTSLHRLFIKPGKLTPINPPLGVGLSRHRRLLFDRAQVYALRPDKQP